MAATLTMTWCNPLRPFPNLMESTLNVEAAEQVFKTSMRKIETGRRTRGGIQLEKSLMIAMIALKARRYIWEEHVMSIQRTDSPAFVSALTDSSSSRTTDSSPLFVDESSEEDHEEGESEGDASETSPGRKRPSSSSSDSESESDEEFDSDFGSPQKRYRLDSLDSTPPVNFRDSEEEFANPAMCQLVTSFDNLLSSEDIVDPSLTGFSDNSCFDNCEVSESEDSSFDLGLQYSLLTTKSQVLTVTQSSVSEDSNFSRDCCVR